MQQPSFRGKKKETGEWVYGFGWQKMDYTEEYLEEINQTEQDALLYTKNGTVLCELSTMGRSTEQRDDDNIELFEGDICLFTPMLVETIPTAKGEIQWDKTRFAIYRSDYDAKQLITPFMPFDTFGVSIKKVGTIHDEKGERKNNGQQK